MFTQYCFIRKNTLELINELERIGYVKSPIYKENEYNLYIGGDTYSSANFIDEYYFDCGTNEELFLALATLRDDTDINQWFVMDVEEYMYINQGDWFIATDRNKGKHIGTQIDPMYCHKATVEEIIEHFKKE